MAKRFYNPSSASYVSQFVPDQLPADLMLKSLGAKQQAYDTQAAANEELAALNIRSLPGEDTRYAKEYKEKIQKFVDESYNQDLAAPDFQRKYKQFVREYRGDQGLKSVGNAVATHDQYLGRIEELTKKGEFAAADEMRNNYMRRFNMYTADDGLGYKGEVSLGDPLIGEGVDRFKENLKFFEPLKESGSESAKFLEEGISYENGWNGISDSRVKTQADRMFNDWATSPGGKQTAELYNMQNGIGDYEVSKLAPEKKQEYQKGLENFMRNEFLEVGRTVVYGKSTTNISEAYNKKGDRDYARRQEDLYQNILTDQLNGVKVESPNLSWEQQIYQATRKAGQIKEQAAEVRKNPNRYAPGTLESLEKQHALEVSKIRLINEDKNKKYREIYDQNLKINTSQLNNAKSKLSPQILKMIDDNANIAGIVGYTSQASTSMSIDEVKQSDAYKKLSVEDKRNLLNYQKELNNADKAIINAKINTEKQWKETYYSNKGSGQNLQYMGVTTTPNFKGGTSQAEQNMINTVRDGYTFYDETGKEITSDDLGFDFKIGGITQQNFKGDTRGRVGTVTRQTPVYDKDDPTKIVKYVSTPVKVIAVPRDPNSRVTNQSYARDYYQAAKDMESRGYTDAAKISRREAMTLLNTDLANKFDQAENSQNFNSGPITIDVGASDGKSVSLQKVNVLLDKLEDGTYNVSLRNTNGSTIAPSKNFNDSKSAQEYILNIGL